MTDDDDIDYADLIGGPLDGLRVDVIWGATRKTHYVRTPDSVNEDEFMRHMPNYLTDPNNERRFIYLKETP